MTDPSKLSAGEPLERIQCQWCQSMNESSRISSSCIDSTEAVRQKTPLQSTMNRGGFAGDAGCIAREATTPIGPHGDCRKRGL